MPIYKMDGKRDGKQKYRVRINYVDNLGKPRQIERVAYGSEEAKQLERELNYQIKQEKPAAKLTVQALYDEYIRAKRFEVRESSIDKTQRILNRYVLGSLKNKKLDKLTTPVLQEWKQSIEELGLGIITRKNIYGEFRALLNYGVKMEYLQKNPLLKVGNFKAPLELKKEMDFYTPEEFKKFITAARDYCRKCEDKGSLFEWNYYVFFCIAFYTGMRKGEINALNWTDIKENHISVTKSLNQKLKGEDRITPPKNRSSIRNVQIPQPLKDVLRQHRSRWEQVPNFTEDYHICGGERALRDTSVKNMNDMFAELAGVKSIRIHDYRHSHASLLVHEGINIQEIAKRLGHSDVSITLGTYSHLYPSESERALSILDNITLNDTDTE
ncbi:MAG: site-specific integrase [Ruminococcus sp.]|nr:site-specific integrase [Ruminococcus sp.]